MLALMLVVAFTGLYELNSVIDGYQHKVTLQWELMEKADMVTSDVLQVRRSEKDFLMRHDMKYPERVHAFLDAASEKAQFIKTSAKATTVKAAADEMLSGLAAYGKGFDAFVTASQERGLDHESGAQGDFRKAAHEVDRITSYNVCYTKLLRKARPMDIKILPLSEKKTPISDESQLQFGRHFTDRMFVMEYTTGKGWHDVV